MCVNHLELVLHQNINLRYSKLEYNYYNYYYYYVHYSGDTDMLYSELQMLDGLFSLFTETSLPYRQMNKQMYR